MMRNVSPTIWNLAVMFGVWAVLLLTQAVAQTAFPTGLHTMPTAVSGSLG